MSEHASFRILVIDDNPDIIADFQKILTPDISAAKEVQQARAALMGGDAPKQPPTQYEIDSATQGEQGITLFARALATRRPYALAFVDVRMPPGLDGIETIKKLWRLDPDLQVVICTAYSDYSAEEITRQLGRTDRLLILKKPFDTIEVHQLASALTEKWRLTQQLRAQMGQLESAVAQRTRELVASETQYRQLFENCPLPICVYEQDSLRFVAANEAAVRQYGYSLEELLALTLRDIALPEEVPVFLQRLAQPATGAGNSGIWRHRKKDGAICEMEITSHPLVLNERRVWFSLAHDVTKRLNLEAQLRQSQKMESVGQLAGGIAHDFNNLLTVINGHTGLLMAKEKLPPHVADPLREISEAGKRAADLTRQLLTFSRKQVMQPQVVDLNEVVQNVSKMLRRVLGEDIALETDFSSALPCIKADLGMMEQVLLNLAVNSRDAMTRGGRLRIATASVMVDKAQAQQNPEAATGRFVRLTFADTGCGIEREHLSRIFEPFFTTKGLDRGTGLGLATVYGIIKQHQGWIEVTSEVGRGTQFDIHLPACDEPGGAVNLPAGEPRVIRGTETILVVEDEALLLKLMQHILEGHGYKVLGCSTAKAALSLWEEHRQKVELLLTDMVLPDAMTGPELAEILQAAKPGLKVIYTSGYDTEKLAQTHTPALHEGANFIQKPFHARKLAELVYDCLNKRQT